MLGWVRILSLLAVAVVSTAPPLPKVSWTVEEAVDLYNDVSSTDYLYQLVETAPEKNLVPMNDSAGRQQLSFNLKETECLKTENKRLEDCAFKEKGELKVCSAVYVVDLERTAIVISCDSVPPRRTRFRRRIIRQRRPTRPNRPIKPSSFTNLQFQGRGG